MSDRGNVERFPRERATPPVEVFRPFYASEMQGRQPKPREWLIDGVLLRGTVMLLAGPPKIGKSLLLQQLLTATALGSPWLARETVQARSFGLFCEDPQDELERRQQGINAYYDCDPADLDTEMSWQSRVDKDAVLVEFERMSDRPRYTPLWDNLLSFAYDEGVQVIGLDTAAAVFGGNENSRTQTTRFLRDLQRVAIEMNGAIIINSHPSRTNPNSYSGNTAWLASVRSGLSLGRPLDYDPETNEPANVRVLRGLGSNYGGGITAENLEYDEGVFVPVEAEYRSKRARTDLNDVERSDLKYRLLMGLKRVLQNGAKVPADDMAQLSMANRARRSPDPRINRVPLNELYRAQQEMLESGMLVRVEVARKCLIRPPDGPYYENEEAWLPALSPDERRAKAETDAMQAVRDQVKSEQPQQEQETGTGQAKPAPEVPTT